MNRSGAFPIPRKCSVRVRRKAPSLAAIASSSTSLISSASSRTSSERRDWPARARLAPSPSKPSSSDQRIDLREHAGVPFADPGVGESGSTLFSLRIVYAFDSHKDFKSLPRKDYSAESPQNALPGVWKPPGRAVGGITEAILWCSTGPVKQFGIKPLGRVRCDEPSRLFLVSWPRPNSWWPIDLGWLSP